MLSHDILYCQSKNRHILAYIYNILRLQIKQLCSKFQKKAGQHKLNADLQKNYSSICFPRKAAADCASLISVSVGTFIDSPLSIITAPVTSPDAIIG